MFSEKRLKRRKIIKNNFEIIYRLGMCQRLEVGKR